MKNGTSFSCFLANIIKEVRRKTARACHLQPLALASPHTSDAEIHLERISLDDSTYNCAGTLITRGSSIQEKIYERDDYLVCETFVTSTRRAKLLDNLLSLEVQHGIDAFDAYTASPGSDGISDQFVAASQVGAAGVKSLLLKLNLSEGASAASHFGFSGTPVFYSLENAFQ